MVGICFVDVVVVLLSELIVNVWLVQCVGEVGEQLELVVYCVGCDV